MIGLQVVMVDVAIVRMVHPGAVVMILPQVMMMDFPFVDVMPRAGRGTVVQVVVEEKPLMESALVGPAEMPFPIMGAAGKEESAGNHDQESV
jgi:hypothetical protein